MSSHPQVLPTPEKVTEGLFLRNVLAGIAAICILIAIVFAAVAWPVFVAEFPASYLYSFTFFFTITMGMFFWTILHTAVDADWSALLRRQTENYAYMIFVLAALAIPLAICLPMLLKWFHEVTPITEAKHGYLNPTFFWIRFVAYFAVVGFWIHKLRTFSLWQDRDGNPIYTLWSRKYAITGIIVMGLVTTFAGIDWLMGLNYHWYSTMWGVFLFAGSLQSAMAVLILTVWVLKSHGYLKPVTSEHYHVMGKYLLAFTIFWAYVSFAQYMLIWYANIPEETQFFYIRNFHPDGSDSSWTYVSMFLVAGHFVFPFVYLLQQAVKKTLPGLGAVAIWILFVHFTDHFWIVMPNYRPEVSFHILDFVCWIFVGSVWLAGYITVMRKVNTFAVRDPRLFESMRLMN